MIDDDITHHYSCQLMSILMMTLHQFITTLHYFLGYFMLVQLMSMRRYDARVRVRGADIVSLFR